MDTSKRADGLASGPHPLNELEPAFLDHDRVARPHAPYGWHRLAHDASRDRPLDLDVPAIGAWREAAGDRDRLLDRHLWHIGVLAGRRHLAQNEERPIGFNL